MRKSRIIALVVTSLLSTASLAGAQASAPSTQTGRHAAGRGMRAGARGQDGSLRGIDLSDAEKTKLKAIHGKYAAQSKSLRESMKPAMQEARAARQKGDTAAARAAFARNKGSFEKMQAVRTAEQAELRAALTAEHQKQFDTNVQARTKRRAEMKAKGKEGRLGRRGGKRAGATG